MLGELVYPYRESERMAPQFASAATLMRRACDATKGILLYEYPTLDGRTFAALAAVSRIMSDYEGFFVTGDRCRDKITIKGFDQAEYEVLRNKKGDLLVVLMNQANSIRKFNFSLKDITVKNMINAVSGEKIAGSEVKGSIIADGFAAFLIQQR